ncbi:MAG TPA: redoxin domain-containing protein [Fimbriimonadaceae bacterium]|nr:redoxin domain-containing protein [Fimbriimonadaceae bacterium]
MKTIAGVLLIAATLLTALATPRMRAKDAAPTLVGGEWINGNGQPFKGRITILHFWTFGCINCRHNLPYVAKWAAKYDPKEVQVVGIHTPELDFEKDPKNVEDAVKRLGIQYPMLIDAKGENWNRYHVEAWPTVVVIDKQGRVRETWVGELQWNGQDGFGEISRKIERLRQEKG